MSTKRSSTTRKPAETLPSPDIFRAEAIEAWRTVTDVPSAEIERSPRSLRWGFLGVLLIAGLGVAVAAMTRVPRRLSAPAVVRSTDRTGPIVELWITSQQDLPLQAGELLEFQPHGDARPVLLTVSAPAVASNEGQPAMLVRATRPPTPHDGADPLGAGTAGTVRLTLGREPLLRLLFDRNRTDDFER